MQGKRDAIEVQDLLYSIEYSIGNCQLGSDLMLIDFLWCKLSHLSPCETSICSPIESNVDHRASKKDRDYCRDSEVFTDLKSLIPVKSKEQARKHDTHRSACQAPKDSDFYIIFVHGCECGGSGLRWRRGSVIEVSFGRFACDGSKEIDEAYRWRTINDSRWR